jgi:hypothetical protein
MAPRFPESQVRLKGCEIDKDQGRFPKGAEISPSTRALEFF